MIVRTVAAVERCDVCVLVIDATEGITAQDAKIAGIAHERGKAMIIAVNKWDAIEKDDKTMSKFEEKVRTELAYMSYAPIVFISAKTGQRVDKLFSVINDAYAMNCLRITTGALNEVLRDAVMRVQPPTDRGKRLKVYYMTQVGVQPPHFVLFCNNAELFHFSYKRYIENCIRAAYGLTGTPVRMTVRERDDDRN